MCEFCPRYGRCCVCESYRVDLAPVAAPVVHEPDSDEGFLVERQGCRIRFFQHSDAMIVLNRYPDAQVL